MSDPTELANRFAYHPPQDQLTIDAHESVRHHTGTLAQTLNALLPDSREKSLALTALQETMMWANAAIAVHGGPLQRGEDNGDRYVVGDGRSYHGHPGDAPQDGRPSFREMAESAGTPDAQPERHPFRPIAPRSETCTCSRRRSDPTHTAETTSRPPATPPPTPYPGDDL